MYLSNCKLDEGHSVEAEMLLYLHTKKYEGLELKLRHVMSDSWPKISLCEFSDVLHILKSLLD